MSKIHYREQFYKDLKEIRDKNIRERVVNKTLEFETREQPLGKKLEGVPFWSVRVGKYRIILKRRVMM